VGRELPYTSFVCHRVSAFGACTAISNYFYLFITQQVDEDISFCFFLFLLLFMCDTKMGVGD
jgi:hypothetical protein